MNIKLAPPWQPRRLLLAALTVLALLCAPAHDTLAAGILRSATPRSPIFPGQPLLIDLVMYNWGTEAWQAWVQGINQESWGQDPYYVTVTTRANVGPGSSLAAVVTRAGLPTSPGTYSLRLRVYYYTGGLWAYEMDNSPQVITFTIVQPVPPAITQDPTDQSVCPG